MAQLIINIIQNYKTVISEHQNDIETLVIPGHMLLWVE
jgi:hypothetical protein